MSCRVGTPVDPEPAIVAVLARAGNTDLVIFEVYNVSPFEAGALGCGLTCGIVVVGVE